MEIITNIEKIYPVTSQTQLRALKISYSLNDSKRSRMTLYCSNKPICIIKRSNLKVKVIFIAWIFFIHLE